MKNESKHMIDDRLFRNLDKFRSLNTEKDWMKVKERMDLHSASHPQVKGKRKNPVWYWSAAAMIIIILGVGWLTGSRLVTPVRMVVATTGELKKEFHLPDGSMVSLNRNSELSYPERFGRRAREISFAGEGYFDVTHNPDKPFKIHIAGLAGVEVLGTAFNINTLQEDHTVKVHVVSGRVAFYSIQTPGTRTILQHDEQAILRDGSINHGTTEDQNFLSWKTGVLIFDQEPVTNVLEDLSNYYDRNFILDSQVGENIRFTSVIDNQDLQSVLEELRLVLGLEYRTEGDTITLYRPE